MLNYLDGNHMKEWVVAETTNARVCTSDDYGKTIICSNGGDVAITLPANGAAAGSWIRFIRTVAKDLVVTAATADTLIAPGDAAAKAVVFSDQLGAQCRVISNGSVWIAINESDLTMTVTP